jgi:hypothetical protein
MADFHGVAKNTDKIEVLLKVVQESKVDPTAGERLNYQERRFFFKHPDIIAQVLAGERSHVRVSAIVRKMSCYGLGAGDVEAIWQVLNQRRQSRPESPPK